MRTTGWRKRYELVVLEWNTHTFLLARNGIASNTLHVVLHLGDLEYAATVGDALNVSSTPIQIAAFN
jgi:hypothetical protein